MVARSQKEDSICLKSASRRQIALVAGRQLQLISTAQLIGSGLPEREVGRECERRRLFRMRWGVYATHPPPYAREQGWMSAVLACGPEALLSDWPAASHWGIAEDVPDLSPHVTVASGRGRSRPGISVHQRGPVDSRDVRRHASIPVVSVDLVLVQLAPRLEESELEVLLVAAESMKLLKRSRLAEIVSERRGTPGIHRLTTLLALEPAVALSGVETLMLPICRRAGVPRPLLNHPIRVPGRDRPLQADLAWPELRLVVELDSQRFHGDWERAEIDRERDQLLALAGWLCHRFVRRRVIGHPEASAKRLGQLVSLRAAERGR